MFGQFKRITNSWEGVLTGKGLEYGGSLIRTEATGYGAVYFLLNMLKTRGEDLVGKRAVISGSGNVATHAAEKIVQLGGKVLTLSDSEGFIHDPDGITQEKIDWVKSTRPSAAAASPNMPTSSKARASTRASGPGASNATSLSPARLRTSSPARMRGRWSRTAASPFRKARTCRRTLPAFIISRTRGSCSRRARPPMPAESPSPASR
jgi:hypothetical protein